MCVNISLDKHTPNTNNSLSYSLSVYVLLIQSHFQLLFRQESVTVDFHITLFKQSTKKAEHYGGDLVLKPILKRHWCTSMHTHRNTFRDKLMNNRLQHIICNYHQGWITEKKTAVMKLQCNKLLKVKELKINSDENNHCLHLIITSVEKYWMAKLYD